MMKSMKIRHDLPINFLRLCRWLWWGNINLREETSKLRCERTMHHRSGHTARVMANLTSLWSVWHRDCEVVPPGLAEATRKLSPWYVVQEVQALVAEAWVTSLEVSKSKLEGS